MSPICRLCRGGIKERNKTHKTKLAFQNLDCFPKPSFSIYNKLWMSQVMTRIIWDINFIQRYLFSIDLETGFYNLC